MENTVEYDQFNKCKLNPMWMKTVLSRNMTKVMQAKSMLPIIVQSNTVFGHRNNTDEKKLIQIYPIYIILWYKYSIYCNVLKIAVAQHRWRTASSVFHLYYLHIFHRKTCVMRLVQYSEKRNLIYLPIFMYSRMLRRIVVPSLCLRGQAV